MTFAFAAAGTGGHVYPAIAVADALVDEGVDRDDIIFFGGDRMEARAVPAAGYEFISVPLQSLRRSLSPQNLSLPATVWKATRNIAGRLAAANTRVMTAFGGYVSVPAAWAARRSGSELFVHEQNAVPGLANRLISPKARKTFVAFPDGAGRLRNVEVVGNPLRSVFRDFDRKALRAEALDYFGLSEDVPVLGVLGGSLGARVLNEVTADIARGHDPDQIAIVHLTGPSQIHDVAPAAAGSRVRWIAKPFEERMELFYSAADLVVSRAGALTVSEITATGTAAVVVPYAAGTAGHQAANAAHLEESGGIVIVPETSIAQVPIIVEQLIADPGRRRAIAAAAGAQGRPDAATVMAQQLIEAAHG